MKFAPSVRLLPFVLIPLWAGVALRGQAPAPASAPTAAAKLGSKIFPWESLVVKPVAVGQRREVVNLPTATFDIFESHVTTLNPGKMSHPPHIHNQEEFIILKEGTLETSLNGKTERVETGSILFFASNDYHNMTNIGDTPATYLVFNITTAATKAAPKGGATAAAVPGKVVSRVFHWDQMQATPNAKGARREIVNSPTTTLANWEGHITTLKIGEVPHAAHTHPDEELVIVKEGVMEVTVNGVTQRGGPGSIFFYGSNDLHGMKNVGGTEATYYVFRTITEATPKATPAPAKTE